MENNVTSLINIINETNKRLLEDDYGRNKCIVKPLELVAKEKGLISSDFHLESGVYLFEECLKKYTVDPRTQLVGIFKDNDRQIIRQSYFDAQAQISELLSKRIGTREGVKRTTPNLQKLLFTDLLMTSMYDYGFCYDFSKIKNLIEKNNIQEAENIASRDWFFVRTLSYFFNAKKIAKGINGVGVPSVTQENINNVDKAMKEILNQKNYNGKKFPADLAVTYRGQKEKKFSTLSVNQSINQDLSKITKACKMEQQRAF